LEIDRAELIDRYQRVLQGGLFSNRAEVRPNMLRQIAIDEAEAFLNFLNQPAFSGTERGLQLHQIGLSEKVVLRLGQATRQFFLDHLDQSHIALILEIVHAYQEGVMLGFIKNLEKYHLDELERTRNALQHDGSQKA
jgi:hypothetical protein